MSFIAATALSVYADMVQQQSIVFRCFRMRGAPAFCVNKVLTTANTYVLYIPESVGVI